MSHFAFLAFLSIEGGYLLSRPFEQNNCEKQGKEEKMKVCVCDSADERRLAKKEILSDYFAEKDDECEIFMFESAEVLLVSEHLANTDIFVIDTSGGDTQGIQALRELKEQYPCKICIMTSDSYDCLDEAMDLGVTRYILNSGEKERYYSALDKAVDDMNRYVVQIKGCNGNVYRLHRNEIVFAEAKARKTIILTTNSKIDANLSIAKIKELLNTPNFINPHYSFVVNSDYISHIEGRDIMVKVNYHYFRVPIASKRISVTKKQLVNV